MLPALTRYLELGKAYGIAQSFIRKANKKKEKNMNQAYQLICCDLDGTLLNEKDEVSEKNKEMI